LSTQILRLSLGKVITEELLARKSPQLQWQVAYRWRNKMCCKTTNKHFCTIQPSTCKTNIFSCNLFSNRNEKIGGKVRLRMLRKGKNSKCSNKNSITSILPNCFSFQNLSSHNFF